MSKIADIIFKIGDTVYLDVFVRSYTKCPNCKVRIYENGCMRKTCKGKILDIDNTGYSMFKYFTVGVTYEKTTRLYRTTGEDQCYLRKTRGRVK